MEVRTLQQGRQRKVVVSQDVAQPTTVPLGKLSGRDRTRHVLKPSESATSERQIHANLAPLLATMEGRKAFYLVFPYMRFTLFDIALHSPAMFNDSVSKPLFVLYQLLKALEHCHRSGVTLGPLSLHNVFVDSRLWVQVRIAAEELSLVREEEDSKGVTPSRGECGAKSERVVGGGESRTRWKDRDRTTRQRREKQVLGLSKDSKTASASTLTASDVEGEEEEEGESTESAKDTSSESSPVKGTPAHAQLCSSSSAISLPPVLPLSEAVKRWQHGSLDNFTYLMLLNHHAGRVLGDPNNHPIFPWVTDFTHPTRGFHDLTKSKYRQNKGDDQLNFAYSSAKEEARRGGGGGGGGGGEPLVAHHVDDVLTDVTYYVYKARRTPREVLCAHVRPRWVPEEYPSSVEKLYSWTPDESIPEFYADPLLFKSIHPDLPDLGLPSWCPSPEAFVEGHRRFLEGDYVSSQLHHWIDLTFGYKLSGEAAVRAKNVYVSLVDKHKNPRNHGIVQLFRTSHPKRRVGGTSATAALLEWETYLGQSSVFDGASFPIDRCEMVARLTQKVSRGESRSAAAEGGPGAQLRTLEGIVEQNLKGGNGGGGGGEEGIDGAFLGTTGDGARGEKSDDSSFEQIPFPDESYASNTPSLFPNAIGISYSDTPLDFKHQPSSTDTTNHATTRGVTGPPPPPPKQRDGAILNAAVANPSAPQNRFRVAKYFRQRRSQNQSDGSTEEYPWQSVEMALPRDSNVLKGLSELEERAHFVARCCKDFADTLGPSWDQKNMEVRSSLSLCALLQMFVSHLYDAFCTVCV